MCRLKDYIQKQVPGTYEAAIVYAGLPEAGDRALLFKTAVKEIAYRHGIMATFMAKINENLPGCGGHVHQSLWDKPSKKNLFYDEKDKLKMSQLDETICCRTIALSALYSSHVCSNRQ